MINKSIRNIIFDLGDVILNIDIPKTLSAFSRISGLSNEQLQVLFTETELFRKFETGSLSEEGFRNLVRDLLEMPSLADSEIDTAWNALLLDLPVARIRLLQTLSTRYNLYLLSNTSSIHIRRVNEILKETAGIDTLDGLFSSVFLSYQMGVMKPDPEIYRQVLEQAGLEAQETLFLDDNLANTTSAEKAGIHVIHVQKPVTILEYLSPYV